MFSKIPMTLAAATILVLLASGPAPARPDGTPPPDDGGALNEASPATPGGYGLRLAGFEFDPAEGLPELPTGWGRAISDSPDLHLVQLHGPTQAQSLEAIRQGGLDIVQYIYPYTYVVWGSASNAASLATLEAVRATAEFAPAFRVQPQWKHLDRAAQDVRVLMYRRADTDAAIAAIQQLGGVLAGRHVLNEKWEIAGFDLPGDQIQAVANVPGVYSIRPTPKDGGARTEMADQVNVNNVDLSNIAFPGYLDWLAAVGLDGQGVVMANVDSGILESHPDLVNRMLPCSGDTCVGTSGQNVSSHGTHTAGIMAGDGDSGTLDGFGFLRGLGVAPGANLVEQNYQGWFTQTGGMLKLMTDSYRNGAVLSGNSWGPSGSPQGYDDDTLQVDIGVRDADPNLAGNQAFTYVLSFMNGNGGTSSQGTPDEGKNLFNIGSTKLQNGSGAQLSAIDDLSSNTAHGPALDGRTIPHLVAPGCEVDSTDTASSGYGLKCGTSMASPHVSGGVALFFEYYRGLPDFVRDPSPALVKAAFLAVARNLAGNNDADGGTLGNPFDSKQGWGRMDLEAVVDPPENSVRYFDTPQVLDNTGEAWVSNVSPLDPESPVRIMLVWTDAPGHGLGGSTPAWNNDLDLVVEVGSSTYRGNRFGPDGFSTTGGTADFKNNTEGVFLAAVPGGGVTIRVVAANINSDGIPGVGDDTDQDFALACYNCAVEPGFTLAVEPVGQEACAPDSASYAIEVGEILGFSDPVTLSVSGVPAGATADFTVNPVAPPDTSTLEITDTASAAPGEYNLIIDGVSGDIQRSVNFDLRVDTGIPGQPTPTAPADGAIDVAVTPILTWTAVPQALAYDLEVALDSSFSSIVYSATEESTSHALLSPLSTLTTHYWRVRAHNSCGLGAWSPTFSCTTMDFPPILLVDDDDNDPDVRNTYTEALAAFGVPYDVWDTGNSDSEPTLAELAPYEVVIWFTGDEFGGSAGPGGSGEAALASWLDAGRCLLLASQDYHYDRGLTAFMQTYLGVANVVNDENQTSATGQGVIFDGLGPYSLSFPYTNYTDEVNPDASAEVAFSGSVGNVAVSKATGLYVTTFSSFGLEGLPTTMDRIDVLTAFFEACDTNPEPDSDLDGVPNEQDCAPMDPENWSEPGPAKNFRLTKDTQVFGNLVWLPPDEPGATSNSYDVIRSRFEADFSNAICVATGISFTLTTDDSDPMPGNAFFYLVRARNDCGDTLGFASDGQPRTGAACD